MGYKIEKKHISEVKSFSSPERVLFFNILLRAIYDLKERKPLIRNDAISWFLKKHDENSNEFDFVRLCEYLDIDHLQILSLLRSKGAFEESYIRPVKKTKRIYTRKYKY